MRVSPRILYALLPVLAVVVRAQYEDVCPSSSHISPCTCDREGVNCNKVKSIDELRQAFQAEMNLPALRAIWLQDTPLTTLPRGIFGKYQISQFNLDSNKLTTVESGAFESSGYTIVLLSLYDNLLVDFPFSDLKQMPNLQALNLADNKLTSIPDYCFGPHNRLSVIVLANNLITAIGRLAFWDCSNLNMVDLSNNRLMKLDASAFEMNVHHPMLQVSLWNNNITTIDPSAFRGMEPAVLALDMNRLTTLPENIFGPLVNSVMQKHGAISLAGNPLTCRGCDYMWIAMNKFTLLYAMPGFTCTNGMQMMDLTLANIGCT